MDSFQQISPKAKIGANVRIGFGVRIYDNVVIGANCTIADHCVIGTPTKHPEFSGQPVVIGEGSIIRSHTWFMKAVPMGQNWKLDITSFCEKERVRETI